MQYVVCKKSFQIQLQQDQRILSALFHVCVFPYNQQVHLLGVPLELHVRLGDQGIIFNLCRDIMSQRISLIT